MSPLEESPLELPKPYSFDTLYENDGYLASTLNEEFVASLPKISAYFQVLAIENYIRKYENFPEGSDEYANCLRLRKLVDDYQWWK